MANLTAPAQAFHSNTTAVDTSQQVTLGTRAWDEDGNEYVYLQGVASTEAGSWVTFDENYATTLLAADAVGPVAIAMAAIDSGSEYGWYQRFGVNTVAKTDTVAADKALFIDGTSGRVDDAGVTGDIVIGAYSKTADSSNVATVWIDYPSVSNDLGAAGAASVAGSDTEVQFNDGGNFGADSGLTYNKTTDTLTTEILQVGTNLGLKVADTNDSHYLIIAPGSDLTADRTLTLTTGDAARTVTISDNATISQDYSSSGSPQFTGVNIGHASDTTLTRASAGVVQVEGVDVILGDTGGTDNALLRADGTGGNTLQAGAATATLSDNNDLTLYDATNDGNPVLAFGASATERLTVTPTYDTGAQTLDYVKYATAVASATADKGLHRFDVDGTDILDIDDGGINFAASKGISIAGTDILTDSAGTATLSNIDALDATTESTIESAIDTLANLTSVQGRTVTLADAGTNAFLGWDDAAGAYENLTAAEATDIISTASTTVSGRVELATTAETTTGTDATRAVTPDGLAGSIYGRKVFSWQIIDGATALTAGSSKAVLRIDSQISGMNIGTLAGCVVTTGSQCSVMLRRVRSGSSVNVLSTSLTIDASETDSNTAATANVINASNDDMTDADQLHVDIESVGGGAAKGLILTGYFETP